MTINFENILPFIPLIVAVGGLVIWIVKVASRLSKMELKVDTTWDFLMRRAVSEAISSGVATKNSPVIVTDEAKKWMKPLLGPIKDYYKNLGRNLTLSELAMEIERRFGEQILNEICIPHGLSQGACLLIAIQAAQEA